MVEDEVAQIGRGEDECFERRQCGVGEPAIARAEVLGRVALAETQGLQRGVAG